MSGGSDTYRMYEGTTHYMEEEYIDSLLIPKIREILDGSADILSGE